MLFSVWILPQVRSLTQSGQFDAGADPYWLPPFYGNRSDFQYYSETPKRILKGWKNFRTFPKGASPWTPLEGTCCFGNQSPFILKSAPVTYAVTTWWNCTWSSQWIHGTWFAYWTVDYFIDRIYRFSQLLVILLCDGSINPHLFVLPWKEWSTLSSLSIV